MGLSGVLGSGKTTFIKGIAVNFGIKKEDITSSSFIIFKEHSGIQPVYHVDLYRTRESQVPDLVLIEWARNMRISRDYYSIHMKLVSLNERKITIDACGDSLVSRLKTLPMNV